MNERVDRSNQPPPSPQGPSHKKTGKMGTHKVVHTKTPSKKDSGLGQAVIKMGRLLKQEYNSLEGRGTEPPKK